MFLFFTCWACSLMGVYSFPRWCFYPEEAPCIPQTWLEPLFTGVRGRGLLRSWCEEGPSVRTRLLAFSSLRGVVALYSVEAALKQLFDSHAPLCTRLHR